MALDFSNIKEFSINGTDIKAIDINNVRVWEKASPTPVIDWTEPFYIKNETESPITITFSKQGSDASWISYLNTSDTKSGLGESQDYYSRIASSNSPTVTIQAGAKKYIGIKNTTKNAYVYNYLTSTPEMVKITSTGNFSIGGNVASIAWGGVSFLTNNNTGVDYSFAGAFQGITNLVDAENLLIPTSSGYNGTCQNMFANCTNLRKSPTIYYADATQNNYSNMFLNCTSLSTASPLTPTTLSTNCYTSMFSGCTSLTAAPELPADTIATGCYSFMFLGCTNLVTAADLPATTLASNCYEGMYFNTKISTLPTISATTLASYCYREMFSNCTYITSVPQNYLPLTTLAASCYSGMFSWCTNLTTVPTLNATSLVQNCYQNMFQGCTSLSTMPTLPATTMADYCYQCMFDNTAISTVSSSIPNVTTLATGCFKGLYKRCTNITSVPSNYLSFTALQPNCYEEMFSGCTGLTNTPTLPATTLQNYCYSGMFSGCTSLTSNALPTLNATSLVQNCYQYMFKGCTGLTTIPSNYLQSTSLAQSCYNGMFEDCSNLAAAPALPATTLQNYCYQNMFSGCTSLVTAPTLSSTSLATFCYRYMFDGCTNLTTAPALPATTLANNCYTGMFYDCTSLTTAPDLMATTGAAGCYSQMFYGCTSLNYIKCNLETYFSNWTGNWVRNVASSGTFVKNLANSSWATGISGIPTNWTVEDNVNYNEPFYYELTSAPAGSVYVTVQSTGNAPTVTNWQYSYDSSTWTSFDPANNSIKLQVGKTYFRASAPSGFASSANDYWRFGGVAFDHNIGGNLCSLVYGSSFTNQHSITNPSDYFFSNLFASDTLVRTVENLILPDETSTKMYYSTFASCSGLTTSPMKMPSALSTYCFESMFQGCTSLSTLPSLTATTMVEGCYMNMFNGCTGITTVNNLTATTLAENCYRGMYKNCSNITTPPTMSATVMADYCCAEMFEGCTGMTKGVRLSNVATFATGCFYNMFKNCTSMTQLNGSNYIGTTATKTVPNYAFYGMFYGCSAYTQNNRITVTAVGDYGMAYMFYGCNMTGSTTLNLRAASPGTAAYSHMFENNTALKNIKCLMSTYNAAITADWIKGVTQTSGTFTRLTSNTSWEIGVDSGIPGGWSTKTATS